MPTQSDLASYSCDSFEELYARVYKKRALPKDVLRGPVDKALDWRVEDGSTSPIAEQLDALLRLVACRLQVVSESGVRRLKSSRQERQVVREKQLASTPKRTSITPSGFTSATLAPIT